MTTRTRSIVLIVLCQVACMTIWFSASAAVPSLLESGTISGLQASLLTSAVQIGFVVGTLTSALVGLADRFDPRRVFAASAIAGAFVNLLLIWSGFDQTATLILRFLTGVSMAGVYPVGMKLAAGWSQRNIGLMIGILVGALTLGSALPHLFSALSAVDWRATVQASSLFAVTGACAISFVHLGPGHSKAVKFRPSDALRVLRRRSVRLANIGYLGHMWELYAMWAWIGPFLDWNARRGGNAFLPSDRAFSTFLIIGSGAIGCVAAGLAADRIGRTTVTIAALATSGLCAAAIGVLADAGPVVLMMVALLWGVSVVADSAQFSAAVAELSEPPLVGTMLTIQTCLGFLLTAVAIQVMPLAIDVLTWRYAFAVLAIGPFVGIVAMVRLRGEPDSLCLAGGQR